MKITSEFLTTLVSVVVLTCWFVFAAVFFLRKKPPSPPDQKRDRASLIGVALQGISYGIVWAVEN